MFWTMRVVLNGTAVAILMGCGGPGLPPAGPKPGEVEVGYGTKDEKSTTGAVSSVSEKEVPAASGPLRLEELLRGRIAGLQVVSLPRGRYTLRIRGTSSLLRDQTPLIIVDGVQVTDPLASGDGADRLMSALAGLTPSDIRQVDVLKDIASTAVYGMKGAGGVIVITTHR